MDRESVDVTINIEDSTPPTTSDIDQETIDIVTSPEHVFNSDQVDNTSVIHNTPDSQLAISYSHQWLCCGRILPRGELVFFTQVFIVYVIIIVSIINLSLSIGDSNLWIGLLSLSLGYLLPGPNIKEIN
jgi:hypothetical protein